jgi:hypothetical protein
LVGNRAVRAVTPIEDAGPAVRVDRRSAHGKNAPTRGHFVVPPEVIERRDVKLWHFDMTPLDPWQVFMHVT